MVIVSNKVKNASWSEINRSESAAPINDGIFMPYIFHKGGASGYIVFFNSDVKSAAAIRKNFQGSILKNNSKVQSFRVNKELVFMAVNTKGKFIIDKNLKVYVSRPCLIMLKNNKIHVSDPSHVGGLLHLFINGKEYKKLLPENGTTVVIN